MIGNKLKKEMLRNVVPKIQMDQSCVVKHAMISGSKNCPGNRSVRTLVQDVRSTVAWSKRPTFVMILMMVHW